MPKLPSPTKDEYTVTESAAILGISRAAVHQHHRRGHFPNARQDKRFGIHSPIYIPRADLMALIEKRKSGQPLPD